MRWTSPLRPEIKFGSLVGELVERPTSSDNLTITYYENEIPPFVKTEMERLYQNSFSSMAAEHVDSPHTSTYVVNNAGIPVTIFLVRCVKGQLRVLNAAIRIGTDEIRRFAEYIFTEKKNVSAIVFRSVRIDRLVLPYPSQQFIASEDIVLALPSSAQAYLDSLGRSTRKYIKYHLKRPARHFPTYRFSIYENDEIDEHLIQAIIDLNTARMAEKNKVSTIDEAHRAWILKIARTYGFVGAVTIDGRICAGVICSRVGANYFMHIIAHDPAYNEFRLGMLTCYMTICETIARGGKEFHFLWGQGDYKYRLLGVQHDLENLTLYRSRAHYLSNFELVLKNALGNYARNAKARLEKNSGGGDVSARMIIAFVCFLHSMQSLKQHLAAAVRRMLSIGSREK